MNLVRALPHATVCLIALGAGLAFAAAPQVRPDAASAQFFETRVRPLLADRCFSCHGEKLQKSGLRLDSSMAMLKGGARGPALAPGEPERSRLIAVVNHFGELKMPPDGKLSDPEINALAEWVRLGAPWPARANWPLAIGHSPSFWSFQPLRHSAVPKPRNSAWSKTPIDAFILSAHERQGFAPNPPADRRTLIRRATFDLIGLPPTPHEIDDFANDPSPRAWEKVLDRLLASPHYGERWGRHWLDLARFAESHGYEQDYDRPNAFHYRDFVIQALNMDLPYDTFVKWQLAGDEFEPEQPLALMATGFLAAGTHATQITKNQVEKERYDELDDKLATTGTVFLGLTFGCARCHDHKFDAIPQQDYYRMLATFTTTVRSDYEIDLDPQGYREAKEAFDTAHAPLAAALRKFEQEELPARFEQWLQNGRRVAANVKVADNIKGILAQPELNADERAALMKWQATIDPQWQALNKPVQDHLAKEPKKPRVLICSEGVPAVRTHTQGGDFLEHTHFLKRGDPKRKEGIAAQSFLNVLMRAPERERRWQESPPQGWRTSYRRRALASWITDVDQGAGHLLARVIVNRLWQRHCGRGLVATPSDFGAQGERPTHPALLDWLARELIRGDWKLKPMHKLIMRSAAYRQSAALQAAKFRADPDNRLVWRHARTRLEAEIIRDSMLQVSGELDGRMFGPGTLDETMKRRSIYFFVKRSKLVPTMALFDAPNALGSLPLRPTTTIAPQALVMMNNANVRGHAQAFAQRVMAMAPDPAGQIEQAYLLALSRRPRAQEMAEGFAFLAESGAARNSDSTAALSDFCQVLFGLNEFVYVD